MCSTGKHHKLTEPLSPDDKAQKLIEQKSSRSSLVDKSMLQQQTEPDCLDDSMDGQNPLMNPEQFYQDLQINLFKPDTLALSRSSNHFNSSIKPSLLNTETGDELQPNSTAEFKLNLMQPVDIKADKVEYFKS